MPLVLVAILILAVLLRGYDLGGPSYWMDEGFSIATAQQWLQTMDWMRSPFYHLILVGVGELSNWHVAALRGLSVAFGLSMVVAGYYTVQRWLERPVAVIFSALLTMTTLEIAWSRQVRMYLLLQLCFWLALYSYHQWRQKQLHWLWPLLATLATIGSHEFGWILIAIFIWYECLQRFKRWNIWMILATLLLAYGGYHLIFPTAPYVNYWWHYWYWILLNYGVLFGVAVLGAIVSSRYAKLIQWSVVIWLGWLWCLSFIVPLLQYRYLMMTFPIILLLAALGLHWLWQRNGLGKCMVGILVGVMIWQGQITVLPQKFYALESDPENSPFSYKSFTPQPDFKAAYDFIAHYQSGGEVVQIATPYPVIHQLYTNQAPDYRIFLNLTGGSYPEIPAGYDSPADLTGEESLLITDQFAEYRMDQRWVALPKELLWEQRNGPWSIIKVYRIL